MKKHQNTPHSNLSRSAFSIHHIGVKLLASLGLACIISLTSGCSSRQTALNEDIQTILEKAGEGDHSAQFMLGFAYLEGYEMAQDDIQAFQWFLKSAMQGNAQAQASIGYMHQKGLGVPQDDELAYIWLALAVTNGRNNAKKDHDSAAQKLSPEQLKSAKTKMAALQKQIQNAEK